MRNSRLTAVKNKYVRHILKYFTLHQICNFASGHDRDMILVSNHRFLGMGNYLGRFSEASDRPEGQELRGGAVGGQEVLQEGKF